MHAQFLVCPCNDAGCLAQHKRVHLAGQLKEGSLPDCAGLDCGREMQGLLQVICEEAGSQSILGAIGTFNELIDILKSKNLHYRAKDLEKRKKE